MPEIDAKLVDAGEQCPCCGTVAKARRMTACGIDLFVCQACGESWFDTVEQAAA